MKRLFAVVHVEDRDQAVRNAATAAQAGCDGVFLISHGKLDWVELTRCIVPCRIEIPYVGINFLDLLPEKAMDTAISLNVSALWMDQTHEGPKPDGYELFSSYAFKYRPMPRDLAGGAVTASQSCHVLTTSGPGTGKPASVAKVQALRDAIGPDHRLALASGVSADNVEEYLPYVDDFLVATGINHTWADLDLGKARELASLVHAWHP